MSTSLANWPDGLAGLLCWHCSQPYGATAAAGLGLGNGDTVCAVGADMTGEPGTAVIDLVLLVAV